MGIEQNKWGNVDVRTPKNKKRNRLCGGKPKRVARHQRNELNNRARLFLRACDRIIKEKRRNISFSKEETSKNSMVRSTEQLRLASAGRYGEFVPRLIEPGRLRRSVVNKRSGRKNQRWRNPSTKNMESDRKESLDYVGTTSRVGSGCRKRGLLDRRRGTGRPGRHGCLRAGVQGVRTK